MKYLRSLIYILITASLLFSLWIQANATIEEDTERLELLAWALENYSISYRRNIALGTPFLIDLTRLSEITSEGFSDIELRYEWNIDGIIESSAILDYSFEEAGTKNIELSIYWILNATELRVYQSNIELFVFSEAMLFVVEENFKSYFESFQSLARERGVLVNNTWFFREDQLLSIDFWELYREFQTSFPVSSDYISVLGNKEFSVSLLRHGNIEGGIENIVLLSSYNRVLFREYFKNSFSDTEVSWNAFLLDDIHIDQLLRSPLSYNELSQSLIQNWYTLLDLRFDMRNHPVFFLSSQVQYLWRYLTQSELYLLLLIPFFITAISVSKHLIGVNTLGIIIPVFLSYLMIDVGIPEILAVFVIMWAINIIIGQYLNRYALLYTPKISFLIICNILIYFLIGHILQYFNLGSLHFEHLVTFVFFIIMSERFLVIVTSKEFLEYKWSILGTLWLSVILALWASIDIIRVFLFSYPEILILLLPINFYMAQFTGLRFTEYLRFKEVMKDIEE